MLGTVCGSLTPRGMQVRHLLELSRDWYGVAVAVVPKSGVLAAQWMGGLSGEAFLPVLRDWHAAERDVLVWDGLLGHRGLQALKTPLPTILQPAASPE
ncbi:MAG TPA: hypothetical protein PLZ36_11420 [Armatimonadota bacterium]|nr:hypothetical protein [Armatimonadota bacterium]